MKQLSKRLLTARWLPFMSTIALCCGLPIWVFELWRAHPNIPFEYSGDAIPHSMHMAQIAQDGWFFTTPRLAAPVGQHFQDWPMPDVLMLFEARFIAIFTNSWPLILNLLFLSTFPLIGASAWWVLRKFGVSSWLACALSVLYAFQPYHMVRGEYHLFLSGYFTVPFGIWLAWMVLRGEPLFKRTIASVAQDNDAAAKDTTRARVLTRLAGLGLTWYSVRTVAMCVLIAMSGAYYAAFVLVFITLSAGARFMTTWKRKPLLAPIAMCVLIFGVVALDSMPAIIYHMQHGSNLQGGNRDPYETELYGLKFAQMVLPMAAHRIKEFGDLRWRYMDRFPLPSEGISSAIGIVSSIGLVSLIVVAMLSLVLSRTEPQWRAHLKHLAFLSLSAIMVATIGGIAAILSLLMSPQIRSWNRISIAIAFCGLAAVGILIDALVSRFDRQRWIIWLLTPVVLVTGMLDQTNAATVLPYKDTEAFFLPTQAYFRSIEARMPKDSAIFQLPVHPFPEGTNRMTFGAYDNLEGYLHTKHLRWSGSGVKGRFESEWQQRLDVNNPEQFLKEISATGFSGVNIDRRAYKDRAEPLISGVQKLLRNQQPMISPDKARVFFDIREFAANFKAKQPREFNELHDRLLYPVFLEWNKSLYSIEREKSDYWYWANNNDVKVSVYNASKVAQNTRLTFMLQASGDKPTEFRIKWPDGATETVRSADKPVTVTHVMRVKPIRTWFEINSDAQKIDKNIDTRDLYFRIYDFETIAAPQK